jgi:hypothetical protein
MKEIKTLSEFADYLNNCEDYPAFEATEIIEQNGWNDTQEDTFDVCNDGSHKVTMMNSGLFDVVEMC